MTQQELGYVELEWTCANCGTRNPGTRKHCASCGAAQPKDVKFELPAQQELIKDEAKFKLPPSVPIFCVRTAARPTRRTRQVVNNAAAISPARRRVSKAVCWARLMMPRSPM